MHRALSAPAALRAYRQRLLAQGRLLEARAVARCITLLGQSAGAGQGDAPPAPGRTPARR